MSKKHNEGPSEVHQFSRTHALEWGVSEAIVISYLAARVSKRKKRKEDGKRWFYNTTDELLKHYPYFSRSAFDAIIKRLQKKGLIEIGNYNDWPQDRTRWFHVSEEVCKQTAEDPVYFRVRCAERYGVCGAVILYHLEQNLIRQREADENDIYYPLVPSRMAYNPKGSQKGRLPYPKRTIEDAIKRLREAGVIRQLKRNSSYYTLSRLLPNSENPPEPTPRNPEKAPRKLDETPRFLDETPRKVDDVTHYKPLGTVEIPFKTPQATPDADVNTHGEDDQLVIGDPTITKSANDLTVPTTYAALKEECKLHAHHFESFEAKSVLSATEGCMHFLNTLSDEQIYEFVRVKDRDKTLNLIGSLWTEFFTKVFPNSNSLFDCFHCVCLDMLVTAFYTCAIGQQQDTAVYYTRRAAYDLCLSFTHIEGRERLRQRRVQYDQFAVDFASPDKDKEDDATLPPAQKARVLRNAVSSRNDRGWLYEDGEWVWDQLIWSHSAGKLAEKFFTKNTDTTVSELLEILDGCVRAAVRELATKGARNDPYFHSRKGLNIIFFFKYLERIAGELRISSDFLPISDPEAE